jgi:hypothetical protein
MSIVIGVSFDSTDSHQKFTTVQLTFNQQPQPPAQTSEPAAPGPPHPPGLHLSLLKTSPPLSILARALLSSSQSPPALNRRINPVNRSASCNEFRRQDFRPARGSRSSLRTAPWQGPKPAERTLTSGRDRRRLGQLNLTRSNSDRAAQPHNGFLSLKCPGFPPGHRSAPNEPKHEDQIPH